MLQLEDYGFCKKGEGGQYVSSGIIELGGKRPNNTNGGHLCEAYTHGMNMVIENTRQLRGQVDDYCPQWQEGIHTMTTPKEVSPGAGCRNLDESRMGQPGDGQCLDYAEVEEMPFGPIRGMQLVVPENESEFLGYLKRWKQHRLVLKQCTACGLMRYPPGAGCPWCNP